MKIDKNNIEFDGWFTELKEQNKSMGFPLGYNDDLDGEAYEEYYKSSYTPKETISEELADAGE